MGKWIGRIGICGMLVILVWTGTVFADRDWLNEELIRLHVVANSDSPEDQNLKLAVRDALTQSLSEALSEAADTEAAKAYILSNLPKLQNIARETLRGLGCEDSVVISFCREAFDARDYETFSLPAGIYDALRVVIGKGEGKNWWCVVFPTLCRDAASGGFADAAAGAGFPDSLQASLSGEAEYEIRFFLLDMLGQWEAGFLTE